MNKIKNLTSALISSLLVVVGFIYAARGLTDFYDKETTVIELLADGALATFVGFIVVVLLIELAISNSLVSSPIDNAKTGKAEVLIEITPNLGKGHTFCKKRNELKRQIRLEAIIRRYFITIEDYQNYIDSGGIKNKKIPFFKKLSLMRMERRLKKANYDDYNFDEIVNGVEKAKEHKEKRKTLSGFRSKRYSKKLIGSLVTGIIFGYFGLKLADNPNWGMVIYLALQFMTFIANGITQYFITRSYILNEYRDQIKEDTNFLWEFHSSLVLNPDWYKEQADPKMVVEELKQPTIADPINESKTALISPYFQNKPFGI